MLHFVLEIFNEQIGIGDRTQNSFPTSSASSGHHWQIPPTTEGGREPVYTAPAPIYFLSVETLTENISLRKHRESIQVHHHHDHENCENTKTRWDNVVIAWVELWYLNEHSGSCYIYIEILQKVSKHDKKRCDLTEKHDKERWDLVSRYDKERFDICKSSVVESDYFVCRIAD